MIHKYDRKNECTMKKKTEQNRTQKKKRVEREGEEQTGYRGKNEKMIGKRSQQQRKSGRSLRSSSLRFRENATRVGKPQSSRHAREQKLRCGASTLDDRREGCG